MDITTEVGTHILVSANLHSVGEAVNRVQHESENLSGLLNQIVSHQPMTTLQILRIAASHSPQTGRFQVFRFPVPRYPQQTPGTRIPPHETDRPVMAGKCVGCRVGGSEG